MVNKCAVSYCSTGKPVSNDGSDEKRSFNGKVGLLRQQEGVDAIQKLCHMRTPFRRDIKHGEKRNHLLYDLNPIPTIHTDEANGIPASVLRVLTVPRTVPRERNVAIDEKPMFKEMDKISSLEDLTPEVSPPGFTFEKHR